MNNEIKEYVAPTLEYLKECVEDDIIFETSNCKALLDYITNLQERIDKAIEYIEIAEEVDPCANNFCILRDKLKNILEGKDDIRKEN